MPRISRIPLILIALISAASNAASQTAVEEIRKYLDSNYPADRPGASVVIMENGDIVHQAGYGLANVELGVPITADTVFRIGSITKQFTAAAIMLLQQRGELSIDDRIDEYLPDYPTHGHHITIEHLLTHTSGIMSYTNIPEYMQNSIRNDLSTEELVGVFDNEPMEFAPGDNWNYNNSGYVLLGAIIEAVSGQSYEDFIADNISAPLQLTGTFYGGPKLIPNRASGYGRDADGNIMNAPYLSMTQPHAAGALLSTTVDLVKWHKALTGGEFIHDQSYDSMTTPFILNDGEEYPYGYGLGMGKLRNRDMISHGGGIHGFLSYSLWLPAEDIYVAVLTNGLPEAHGPGMVARMITAIALGDPYPDRQEIELPDAVIDGLVGKYTKDSASPMEISLVDGKLTLAFGDVWTDALLPENRETYFFENSLQYLDVEWDGNTAERLIYHHDEGLPPDVFDRAPQEELPDDE